MLMIGDTKSQTKRSIFLFPSFNLQVMTNLEIARTSSANSV